MFKIPEWEKDVPKGSDTFGKNTKKKKETLLEKPLHKSVPENNITKKNSILNGIGKHKSKKVKHIKKDLKQTFPINKTVKSVNYANTKNINGIKGKLKNKTKKADKIKKILNTIGNVETHNGEQSETAFVKKFVKSQLENKRKNGKLLNTHKQVVETEITASNHKLNGNNYPGKSAHDLKNNTGSKNKSKKSLDNEISLPLSNSHIQSNVNKKGLKRKHNNKTDTGKDPDADSSLEGQNLNSDLLDEAIINAKKKKLSEAFENDDREDLLFAETKQNMVNTMNNKEKFTNKNKVNSKAIINGKTASDKKKESIKKLLENKSHRRPINISGINLRTRMMDRLKAAQFRYLNEKLYTSSGSDAQTLFQNDPAAFQTYHEGYKQQLKKWPVNPLDVIVKRIQKMPKSCKIADMGCGEAALAKRIPHTVRSFDLVAKSPGVEACDMAHTPLLSASIDVAVYCLALMGTDLTQYLVEANRVLKIGGHLLIAEVESRFDKVEDFTKELERLGFKLKKLDNNNNVFLYMEFTKTKDPPVKKSKLPVLTLKPCMYKKR